MSLETTTNENLYNIQKDKNLISNNEKEKTLNESNKENTKKQYMKILEQVIENSDVILEVLDSRDPLNTRSKEIESSILRRKDEKKIILILNKIDLIPLQNALDWQKYLQREFGTILFKSNTQNQNSNLSQSTLFSKNIKEKKDYVEKILNSNRTIGSEDLLNLLKNYCRTENNIKTNINVGVIGFPNVGKSSLINSLTRGKNVKVSSIPGFTKGIQEVILDNNIKLLDCPGVVLNNNNDYILNNVIRTEEIKEPIEIVNKIIQKVNLDYLVNVYNVDFSVLKNENLTCEKFLYLIGQKMGKIKKGGIVDLDKCARIVINDWNEGKIKYFTCPPGIDKNEFLKTLEKEKKEKMDLDK
jgi:nuclear GTP-binding protein